MLNFFVSSKKIKNNIYIPKYYDPTIKTEFKKLERHYKLIKIKDLINGKKLEVSTGHEIGKMAYGTGNIPFVRTSDISNWEIKTIPKQGVSEQIYNEYRLKQDVKEGDIFLVRDGTYLIGSNCFITNLDKKILFQSHILKFRILHESINPILFFIALNSKIVQRQIRNNQFTADIIDTIGDRFSEILLPISKSNIKNNKIIKLVSKGLKNRNKLKKIIRYFPYKIEKILITNKFTKDKNYLEKKDEEINQDTLSSEIYDFNTYWIKSNSIKKSIYLPKYYDPSIVYELKKLEKNNIILSFQELKDKGLIEYQTGDEIGKMAYGTGSIPFIRTSDFSNWEIKHDPKQGISEDIYQNYKNKQNLKENDIFLVRDGTYLVGSSAMVTSSDSKSLYCGGLYKINIKKNHIIDPWLFFGLLNTYIVKKQMRSKQFTRDVIDTLGHRIDEVLIPIPKNNKIKKYIKELAFNTINERINIRNTINNISKIV